MSKKSLPHKLRFNKKVDITNSEKIHRVSFEFSKPYIKDKDVLNIGSWVGNYESLVHDYSRKMIGLEIEKRAIDMAKIYCPRASFIQGSILNTPFLDESFDIVTMWLVLEHLPQHTEEQAFSEVRRILKDGGYLILSTPNYHWLNNILDPAYYLISHRHYRKKGLLAMVESAKFKVGKVETKGGVIYTTSVILFYLFKYLLRKKIPQFKWLNRMIDNEFKQEGFADIYLVTKKI